MKRKVELNADIGEGMPWDESLLDWITAANIGCGVHAGSFEETLRVATLCQKRGILLGAHPGYPDREGFGRRSATSKERTEWATSIVDQLNRMVNAVSLDYMKPHGAVYHDLMQMERNRWVAQGVVEWLANNDIAFMGMPDTDHEWLADVAMVPFIREGFAERGYDANGTLIPRGAPGAELESIEEIVEQTLRLAESGVESICVHGDREGCVEIARAVRKALLEAGYGE